MRGRRLMDVPAAGDRSGSSILGSTTSSVVNTQESHGFQLMGAYVSWLGRTTFLNLTQMKHRGPVHPVFGLLRLRPVLRPSQRSSG